MRYEYSKNVEHYKKENILQELTDKIFKSEGK